MLLRLLLVLPNAVVLAFVELAALPVLVVVWCWTLLMGRPPATLWRFLRGVVQWQARTSAYAYLLTSRYPPFTTRDAPYPVTISVGGPPPRLHRLAVLFRFLLTLPALVLANLLTTGASLFLVVAWVAGLVLGHVPRPLHVFLADVLRYNLRATAYYWMLTPEYPWGPLGDRNAWGSLEDGTLALTGSARGIAIAALVLGIGGTVGNYATFPALTGQAQRTTALEQWNALASRAAGAEHSYATTVVSCGTDLACTENAVGILRASLATQISSLEQMQLPTATTQRDRAGIVPLLQQELLLLGTMEQAPDTQAFLTSAGQLQPLTQQLRPVVRRFVTDLSVRQLT